MNLNATHSTRRPRSDGGFSLIELVVVMVIAAVMAAVAVPTLSSLASTRSSAAARLLVRDLSYARERAIATGLRTWIVFNVGTHSYTLLQEPSGSPGRNNAIAVIDMARQKAFNQTFNGGEYAGVTMSSAAFDGAAEVGFDWLGKPLNSAQNSLAANGVVTLSGGKTVTVQIGTGLISTP